MALTKGAKIAIGVGVAIAVLALVWVMRGNDIETDVRLKAGTTPQDACPVDTKPAEDRVKRNGKVTWKIDDGTCSRSEAVMVGNFRTSPQSTATNCDNATAGGAEWPFEEPEAEAQHRRRQGNTIALRVRGDLNIPNGELPYYYDICTGPQNLKSDPLLVIER